MKSKGQSIQKRVPVIITSLLIGLVATLKLAAIPQLVEIYSKIGLLPYIRLLGAVLLVFLFLFLWSKTLRLGFLLLTGYFGGAMAVELSHGTVFVFPALILSFVWLSAYLRDPGLFEFSRQKRKAAVYLK